MTEPDAWEPTELERKLLDAAKSDRVPAELGQRMASALAASSLSPTAASAATKGSLLFSKAGLWGALSLAVLSGSGVLYTARSASRAETLSRAAVETPAAAPQRSVAVRVPVPVPAPVSKPEHESTPAEPPTTSPRELGPSRDLREEISLLDRARAALERNDPQRASTLLDQHGRRFPTGTLRPEAEALRIETLVRLGDTARAQRLAQRFIAAHPAHPLSERVASAVPAPDPP